MCFAPVTTAISSGAELWMWSGSDYAVASTSCSRKVEVPPAATALTQCAGRQRANRSISNVRGRRSGDQRTWLVSNAASLNGCCSIRIRGRNMAASSSDSDSCGTACARVRLSVVTVMTTSRWSVSFEVEHRVDTDCGLHYGS